MAKDKNKDEKKNRALLNKKAAEALKDLVAQVQFYIKMMSENKDLEKNNAKLIGLLKEIDKELDSLSTSAKENSYVDLQQIMSLSNKLNEATDKVNLEKFIPSIEAYKKKFGQRLVGLQKDAVSSEAKMLENMQTRMKSGMMKIEENATILRNNVKQPSIWKKFTRAVSNFAKAASNKFMSLFRKAAKPPKAPTPPSKPLVQHAPITPSGRAQGAVKTHDQELKSAVGKRTERKVYPRLLEKQERDRQKQKQSEATNRRNEGEKAIQVELKSTKKPEAPQRPPRQTTNPSSNPAGRLSVGPPNTPPPNPPTQQRNRALPNPPNQGKGGAITPELNKERSRPIPPSQSAKPKRDISEPPKRPPPRLPNK
jgi:hypothetical protein